MVPNGELIVHRRVAEELERNVRSRDWWLNIRFWLEDEDVDPSVAGIGREVDEWLATMDPDLNLGRSLGKEFPAAAITVEVKAAARGKELRGAEPLLINPLPVYAYFVNG